MSLNGRLEQLEKEIPTTPQWFIDYQWFCRNVIRYIDAKMIVNQPDEKQEMFLSLTVSDHLTEEMSNNASWFLAYAQEQVQLWAKTTGWRSGINGQQDENSFRANSTAELRSVMSHILATIDRFGYPG